MEAEKIKKQRTPGKIIAWIVSIAAVLLLLHNPAIFDAVLTFCLAGVVPGTGVVLSPNAVIVIVGGVLGFIVLLIIGIPLIRRAFRRRSRVALHPTRVPLESAKEATKDEVTKAVVSNFDAIPVPRTIVKKPRHPLLVKLGVATVLFRAKLQALLAKLGPKTARILSITGIVIAHEARQVALWLRKAGVRLLAVTSAFLKSTHKQILIFWRWLKPHLNAFDTWLARQVKPYQKKLVKKARKNDTLLLLRDIVRGIKRELKPLSPFVLWGKFRDERQQSNDSSKDVE